MGSQHIKLMSHNKTENMLNINIKREWKKVEVITSCAIIRVIILLWKCVICFCDLAFCKCTQATNGTAGSEVWSLIDAVGESRVRRVTLLIKQSFNETAYLKKSPSWASWDREMHRIVSWCTNKSCKFHDLH